jgi:hypothetical protein
MSQITTKFIQDNAVIGTKIRLQNNENLRARNAANSADINIAKLTSGDVWEFQLLPRVEASLPVPSQLKQLATVEYIQNYVLGKIDAKDSVSLLSTTNVPLTGATPLIIDGATVTDQQSVGLIGQSTASANGIYVFTDLGATYSLARREDSDSSAKVTEGMYFPVTQGTDYQGYEVLLTTPDPIVLGTTALTFVAYPTVLTQIAGDMLLKSGNTWSVDLASLGGLESTNPGNVAGQLRVKVDTAALEKDQTTRRDPSTGAVVAKKSKKALFTLIAGDITNQYVDLVDVAADSSVKLNVAGAGYQVESVDYTVNYTGGSGSKTRVTFAGGLATAGVSALASGDVIVIEYTAF